eukprot:125101_1
MSNNDKNSNLSSDSSPHLEHKAPLGISNTEWTEFKLSDELEEQYKKGDISDLLYHEHKMHYFTQYQKNTYQQYRWNTSFRGKGDHNEELTELEDEYQKNALDLNEEWAELEDEYQQYALDLNEEWAELEKEYKFANIDQGMRDNDYKILPKDRNTQATSWAFLDEFLESNDESNPTSWAFLDEFLESNDSPLFEKKHSIPSWRHSVLDEGEIARIIYDEQAYYTASLQHAIVQTNLTFDILMLIKDYASNLFIGFATCDCAYIGIPGDHHWTTTQQSLAQLNNGVDDVCLNQAQWYYLRFVSNGYGITFVQAPIHSFATTSLGSMVTPKLPHWNEINLDQMMWLGWDYCHEPKIHTLDIVQSDIEFALVVAKDVYRLNK